jgi:hypothetical protein
VLLLGVLVLAAALWGCWRYGLPLAGSLVRGREAKVPGVGTADDGFDKIVAPLRTDRALTRVIKRARL